MCLHEAVLHKSLRLLTSFKQLLVFVSFFIDCSRQQASSKQQAASSKGTLKGDAEEDFLEICLTQE